MTIDQIRCPLCGSSNQCGMVAGESSCWCTDLKIAATVLEQIPAEARNLACVCRKCAGQAVSRSPEDSVRV